MKKIIALAVIISLAAFMLFSAGGCSKIGQQIAETISEETIEQAIEQGIEDEGVDVDIDEGEVTITTDEGETSWGLTTELSPDFPNTVPLYPNMTLTSEMTWQEDGEKYFVESFETNDDGKKIFDWYMSKFPAEGWTVDYNSTTTSNSDEYFYVTANDGVLETSVIVSVYEGDTSVSINVGPKP